jgi:hypothetical protein
VHKVVPRVVEHTLEVLQMPRVGERVECHDLSVRMHGKQATNQG